MELSIDSYQRRVVKPIWNSAYKYSQSTQLNMWPIRQQTLCKRFYGNCKSKPNNSFLPQSNNRHEIVPISMKLDIDEFEKNKSYTSMAFCSTSKVKYAPLPGTGCDNFAGLKLGTPHPTIFPALSRPLSRPVLLHGKRYTVVASETNRSNTAFTHSDQDDFSNFFKHEHVNSDQRKRFNETEQNKSDGRSRGTTSDGYDIQLRKSYCLSGHRMKFSSSKVSFSEKFTRLQPRLNIENKIILSQKYHGIDNNEVVSDRIHISDFQDEQISEYENVDSVITIDIVDKTAKPTQLNSEEMIQCIKKNISKCMTTFSNEDSLILPKEWIGDLLLEYLEGYKSQLINDQSDLLENSDIGMLWQIIQPVQIDEEQSDFIEIKGLDEFKNLFANLESNEIAVSQFLDLFSTDENIIKKIFWLKIFEDLEIKHIDESILSSLISFKSRLHSAKLNEDIDNENLSLLKASFWIHLFKIFSLAPEISIERWMEISVIILTNKNEIAEQTNIQIIDRFHNFISKNFQKGQSNLKIQDYLESIVWTLTTHKEIIGQPFSTDEIAAIRYLIDKLNTN